MERFRTWAPVLAVLVIALAVRRLWLPALAVAAVLAFYLLAVRPSRCRVETTEHRPCRSPSRGLLGTCDRHARLKRGLPRLVSAKAGALMFPLAMWPTPDAAVPDAPAPEVAPAPAPGRVRVDRTMVWLVWASVVIATASFVHDLMAS
jgi:hypothetical protein